MGVHGVIARVGVIPAVAVQSIYLCDQVANSGLDVQSKAVIIEVIKWGQKF
jgi:hypothetical protein